MTFGMTISIMGCAKSTGPEKDAMTTDSLFVLTEPPGLDYISGEETLTAERNGYSWNCNNFDGTWNSVEADGPHPLDCGERMETCLTEEDTLTLVFGVAPESYTVRCWPDTALGTGDFTGEQTVATNGWEVELLEGGYVYQVIAQWDYENFHGNAYYCFHVVQITHIHLEAAQTQTVDDPVSGYCGNTLTTVNRDGKEYTLSGSDSITLTDIVINLAYAPENVCRCVTEFSIITEDGTVYGVNLHNAFVRCETGQADLTGEQVEKIQAVIQNLS